MLDWPKNLSLTALADLFRASLISLTRNTFRFTIWRSIIPRHVTGHQGGKNMVLFGADRVAEYAHLFIGRTALLTGPSGVPAAMNPLLTR